jgi:hypothetical protein
VALLAVALPSVSSQAHAECRLLLQGYGHNDSSLKGSSSSYDAAKIGVAVATLSCSSSDGTPVTVAINSTYLQQHAAAFTGVQVLSGSACKAQAAAADPSPIHALLYFCSSSHQLTLQQPVVQNIQLALAPAGSDAWHQAILAFGSNVNASISGAVFSDNAAGTLMVVRQQAVLTIANSAFKRSNSTWGGEQVAAVWGDTARAFALNCKHS